MKMIDKEYHARKEISASDLKLLKKSLRHYIMKDQDEKESSSLELGTLFHKMILEPNEFESEYIVSPFSDKRTKDYKNFELENSGKVILTNDTHSKLTKMKEALLSHQTAKNVFCGESEGAFFSKLKVKSNSGINLGEFDVRAKIDHISKDTIFDLKTTVDTSYNGFIRQMKNLSYHIQAKHYLNVYNSLGNDIQEFCFVAVQNCHPFNVAVYYLHEDFLKGAQGEINSCFQKLHEYNNSPDKYTHESKEIEMLVPTPWFFANE